MEKYRQNIPSPGIWFPFCGGLQRTSACIPQTEKILHAPAHTHTCSNPTEASLLQIYHHQNPLTFKLQEKHIHIVSIALVNKTTF